jgi:hypothetical protein
MFVYHLKEALKWISGQSGIDRVNIASIEYRLLGLLSAPGSDEEQLTLHQILASEPKFFLEVLCDAYKPEAAVSEEKAEHEPTEVERAKARLAFRLLRSWRTPPGLMPDGKLDIDVLESWTKQVREGAKSLGRIRVADLCVGAVLFHTPVDALTGMWPSAELSELLERIRSKDLEHGLELEVINSRGATVRGMQDGGAQERALSADWNQRASLLPIRWKRARALCKRVADMWLEEAKRMDVEAEQWTLRWSR